MQTKISFLMLKGLLYGLLLTPLWIWSIFLFPFITTKILYFRMLVEIALVLYVILAIQHPEIRPRWNWLLRMVWIYLGMVIIASLFGMDMSVSFMSSIERGEGIVTLIHFVLYFTMLSGFLQSKKDRHNYLFFAVTVSFATALYGLAQLLNYSFVIHGGASRISGTIGNPAFFAAFMIFGIFLTLYLLYDRPAIGERLYLWLVFGFELVMLFLTQTRGAIIGAAIAFLIYLIANLIRSSHLSVRIASGLMLVLLAGGGLLVYQSRNASWVLNNGTLQRLATISPSDITTQSRLDTWQASWKGARDRLFIGYGYENFNIAFNKYFPARIFKDSGSQIWFDRAHNIVFDVLVTSGLFGLVAYFGIFAAAFYLLWRLFRANSNDYAWHQPVILAVLLIAYVIQNLFVFDTQATYLMFFLTLGVIASLWREHLPGPFTKTAGLPAGIFLPVVLSILLIFAEYFINIEPALANLRATQGIRYGKMQQYREIKRAFTTALSYGTYMDIEIRQKLMDYANEAAASGTLTAAEQEELFNYALEQVRKSLEESPNDVKNYIYAMNILNRYAGNPSRIAEVYFLGDKALALSPTRPQIYTELGQAAFNERKFDKGLDYFRKAIELNPEPKESHFNYLLASILSGRGDIASSESKLITEDLGYQYNLNDYLSLARAYLSAGNQPAAIESFKQGLLISPKNQELYVKIAATYGEMCDLENARLAVDKVVELNKDFAVEAYKFINQLETKCQSVQ